ncbi:MAG: polymer-forming cytoskeletal protein [Verrucomicrobiota bacterium]
MAVSTYCRRCGDHLKIEKGKAVLAGNRAGTGIGAVRATNDRQKTTTPSDEKQTYDESVEGESGWMKTASGAAPSKRKKSKQTKKSAAKKASSKKKSTAKKKSVAKKVAAKDKVDRDPNEVRVELGSQSRQEKEELNDDHKISAGEFFGLGEEATPEVDESVEVKSSAIKQAKEAATDLNEGSMGAMIGQLVEQQSKDPSVKEKPKMPVDFKPQQKRRFRQKPRDGQKSVRCYRCNHHQNVSVAAISTQCERCNTYIGMEDYDIRESFVGVLRTRGNVVVHRRGSVKNCEICCGNLTVLGGISAKVDCSGTLHLKNSGKIFGVVHCQKVIVDRGVVVEFPDGLATHSAEIGGELVGNVTCAGVTKIFKSGKISGDAIAHTVDLLEGGILTGKMLIDPDLRIELPVVYGYNPNLIE